MAFAAPSTESSVIAGSIADDGRGARAHRGDAPIRIATIRRPSPRRARPGAARFRLGRYLERIGRSNARWRLQPRTPSEERTPGPRGRVGERARSQFITALAAR